MLKIDLHVHTHYSYDGFSAIKDVFQFAKKRGLDGVAIVDHNTVEGALRALARRKGMVIIPGIEVSTVEGHLIGLGVTKVIPGHLTTVEAAEKIKEDGGIVVVPHPYKILFLPSMMVRRIEKAKPEAIEIINASSVFLSMTRKLSERLAEKLKIAKVAGSDSHLPSTVGRAYTIVNSKLGVDDVLQAIEHGKTSVAGSSISLEERVYKAAMIVKRRASFSVYASVSFRPR